MPDKTQSGYFDKALKDEKNVEHLRSMMRFYSQALSQPMSLWSSSVAASAKVMQSMMPGGEAVETERGDRRFTDDAWDKNPALRALRDSYLTWARELVAFADTVDLEPRDRERAKLLLSTFADTVAPTNMIAANPAALKRIMDTGGTSIVDGLKNFVSDLKDNGGMPSMVDKSAFQVGGNLALSPGHVVYRTPHLELIQYSPTTETVQKTPLFLIPPQINKFYVYDLAPGRSFVEYMVAQGHQVFIVSWFNPDAEQADWGLESYVDALDDATNVAVKISGSDQLHVVGACSGGISLATLLATWAARGIDRARSTTLLVTVLDTDGSAHTSMGLMTSLETLEIARMTSGNRGVLKGQDLAKVFAWLRPNELVWSYWVNNYLMGEAPPAFDLLYWNADTTSLPAALHSDFIDVLQENALTKAGALTIGGCPVDLSKVTCDAFIVAGTTDHITPWEGCYRSTRMLGGKTEFCLSSSGHVQAIVNPPGKKRAQYQLNDGKHDSPETFLAGAKPHEGTWWTYWSDWLKSRSDGERKAPTKPGSKAYPPLGDAPGTYVLKQEGQR